jgi:hypothetical protein
MHSSVVVALLWAHRPVQAPFSPAPLCTCCLPHLQTPCLQVRLVCEYCDRGSLREALDLGAFSLPDGSVNYPAVLDTAIEIATAVSHLHIRNVLHSDLKVGGRCWRCVGQLAVCHCVPRSVPLVATVLVLDSIYFNSCCWRKCVAWWVGFFQGVTSVEPFM